MNIFKSLLRRWRHLSMYVIADANDNSVTLSRALVRHMRLEGRSEAKAYVARLSDGSGYGFTLNPQLGQESQLGDVMYNTKYRCVGFASLCPTVNRIFYDYGIPAFTRAKLSVEPFRVADMQWYRIHPPRRKK